LDWPEPDWLAGEWLLPPAPLQATIASEVKKIQSFRRTCAVLGANAVAPFLTLVIS
jgi:hypothetical protein